MELEAFELVLLRRPASAPDYPDDELDRIQREHLDFHEDMHPDPAFAMLSRGDLRLVAVNFDEHTLRLIMEADGALDVAVTTLDIR